MSLFKTRLLTPGPTDVPPEVLEEMAKPVIHHRTKAYQAINLELNQALQRLFRTQGPVLTLAGSGTTAFEAAQISLAKPGSTVISISGGKFGERWQDIYDQFAPSLQLRHVKIDVPWGHAVTADRVRQALAEHPDCSVVALVHSETSTATACDLQAIAQATRGSQALLLADAITSLGAMSVEMDAWGVDAVVTGSQKALMLPPGLGFVGLGPRALQRLEEVKAGPMYAQDLRRWLKGWQKNDPPFTPPVSLVRGQLVALRMIEGWGLEKVWARTRRLAEATRAALRAMGLKLISQSPSDSVTGAFYPEGLDDAMRAKVRDRHAVHLAGGQDGRGAKWKTSIFRLNHMGYVDAGDTLAALMAIESEFIAAGVPIQRGVAVAAAVQSLA